ncbi:site-specific integrase [Candidatus Poribacteria bacterium]|nr:site-specific integrase [Candidatus Poribacteria bacterium]
MEKTKRRKILQPRVLDELQQQVLLDTLKNRERDRMLVHFCLRTGLRNSEACGMNIGDIVKFGNIVTTLEVRAAIAKNKVSRRIPLVNEVRDAFRDFINWKMERGEEDGIESPLFCTLRTRNRLAPRDFQRIMEAASNMLGLRFTPHDLRHTFGTELYRATNDLESVRIALGHSSLDATLIYMHTSPDILRQRFETAFGE